MENKKSGVPGVSWDKKNKKWLSRIKIKHKTYYLGRYYELEDAIKARKEAEEKFGVDKDKYKKDLIGKKFGELTVLEFVDYTKQNSNWLCKCSCGKECVVSRVALIQGNSKTCGHGEDVKKAFEVYKDKYLVDDTNVALIKNKLLKSNTSGVRGGIIC